MNGLDQSLQELEDATQAAKNMRWWHFFLKTKKFNHTMQALRKACSKTSQYIEHGKATKQQKDTAANYLAGIEAWLAQYWNKN